MSLNHAKFILFSFENQAQATVAYDAIKDFDSSRLIPLPPEIDKGCGLSLRINFDDFDKVIEIFKKEDISFSNVYTFEHENFKRKIEKYVF
ncbi:MAG: DUF3343 domain-containing protein [Tissierellia bacterium]|nr:DUF3343 domain-containing protein [Tissierellia bacterium]